MRAILISLACFLAGSAGYADSGDKVVAGQMIGGGRSAIAETVATAEKGSISSEIFASESASMMGLGINLLGFFIIVAGFAVVGWYLFRKGVLRKPGGSSEGKLKVVENRMLGNRQYLMVVEYEENKILLGVGPGKIDYLTTLSAYKAGFPQIEPQASEKVTLESLSQFQ